MLTAPSRSTTSSLLLGPCVVLLTAFAVIPAVHADDPRDAPPAGNVLAAEPAPVARVKGIMVTPSTADRAGLELTAAIDLALAGASACLAGLKEPTGEGIAIFAVSAKGKAGGLRLVGVSHAGVRRCVERGLRAVKPPASAAGTTVAVRVGVGGGRLDDALGSREVYGGLDEPGDGAGSGMHRPSPTPVALGELKAGAGLDKNIVRRFVRRSLPAMRYCYERQLIVDPKLEGSVTLEFTIAADGVVSAARARGIHAEVEACITAVIKGIRFPTPTGEVKVSYPLVFSPTR